MVVERVTMSFPPGLSDRAHIHGLNVSRVSANAVLRAVQAMEKEAGASNLAEMVPAIASHGGKEVRITHSKPELLYTL